MSAPPSSSSSRSSSSPSSPSSSSFQTRSATSSHRRFRRWTRPDGSGRPSLPIRRGTDDDDDDESQPHLATLSIANDGSSTGSAVSSLSSKSAASRWLANRASSLRLSHDAVRVKSRDRGRDRDRASRWSASGLLLLLAAASVLLQFSSDSPVADDLARRGLDPYRSYYASFTRDSSHSLSGSVRPQPQPEKGPLAVAQEELQDNLQFHRILQHFQLANNELLDIPSDLIADVDENADGDVADEEGDAHPDADPDNQLVAYSSGGKQHRDDLAYSYSSLITASTHLPPYTLQSALQLISTYRTAFALLIYDPPTDEFYVLYSRKHVWSSAVGKLLRAMHSLTFLLKLEFADTLELMRKRNQELVIPVSSGDYPLVADSDCVRDNLSNNGSCVQNDAAPVLQFGSVFRQPMFPNMIAMPPPEAHHLSCFEEWAVHTTVCSSMRAKSEQDPKGELIYAKEFGIKWKDLKDQVVWRGTDFGYLGFVHPDMKRPKQPELSPNPKAHSIIDSGDDDGLSRISATLKSPPSSRLSKKEDALTALKEDFDLLVPRWKGVVHTAEAELAVQKEIEETARGKNEARRMKQRILPWANIKFSQFIGNEGVKAKTLGSSEYRKWEKIDFPAVGESLSLEELARYKYHIDLGGGGGTTWSGTIHKLAFPGLLFHHVTPTKDYFHDYMKPWKHYVPVAPDLNDLKDKFEWAQSNPQRAFQIARNGSELMRFLSSPKGMEERFQKDILEPLRAVINAYVPLSQTLEYKDKAWREVMVELEGAGNVLPILKCTGESSTSCEQIVGKEAFLDRKVLRKFTNAGGFESKETPPQANRQLTPWAHEFFVDINQKPDTTRETALFWHIPKSGGTTVKNLYHCTGQTLAHRGGVDPKFGHDNTDELVVFKPTKDKNGKYVNVDTTIKEGILRAKELGLVQSHFSDIIFTMEPTFAGQNLYDKKNKGRILALFRHPVERMVSKFYYLQVAHWERGYRPDWANLSLMEWIEKAELKDDNLIVRKLVEKSYNEPIDETDLMHAKAILRRRVVVGLMNQMEESVHRFNIVLGIDESLESNSKCMNDYFGKSKEKDGVKNSNKHPKVNENSPEWQKLAEKEWLDMRLYAYAEQLFQEQKETIYSYM